MRMSRIPKVFNWLDIKEDEDLWRIYKQFYGPLMRLSMVFISWEKNERVSTFGLFIVYMFVLPFHTSLIMITLYYLREELVLRIMLLHYSLILILLCCLLFQLNLKRKDVASMHRFMAWPVGEYCVRGEIYNENEPILFGKNKLKQIKHFLIWPVFTISLGLTAVIVLYLTRNHGGHRYADVGINMHLPLPIYYPFPTQDGLLYLTAILSQLLLGSITGLSCAMIQLMFFCMSESILFELRVLRYAIRTVFKRADNQEQLSHLEVSRLKFSEHPRIIDQCLKECVIHHHRILEFMNTCQEVLKWPVSTIFFFGTGAIGLSLCNTTATGSEDSIVIGLHATILFLEVGTMFIMGHIGREVTSECELLRDELYYIEWHNLDIKNRKLIMSFFLGINKPTVFKGILGIPMNMETFTLVVKSAYSFFNVMGAKKIKK